jgi:hypothetical protein
MIKLTRSQQFLKDLESALEWLYFRAIEDGKDTDKLEKDFKNNFIKTLALVQANPFIYSAYSSNNPTRRAIFFHGLYIIEYQLIPVEGKSKEAVDEVILTSIVPARSERYLGAYDGLESFELKFEEEE